MARDLYHNIVRAALEAQEWTITDDPYYLKNQTFSNPLMVDLGAENFLEAEKELTKIAVEVKCFHGPSVITDFHNAIGQLLNYRISMKVQEPNRILVLAIPEHIYEKMENEPIYLLSLSEYNIPFFVYNLQNEIITKWIGL